MILIADSGSSKPDWRWLDTTGDIGQANGPGFNPYYQPIDHLRSGIQETLVAKVNGNVSRIFYYGSGASSERNQRAIQSVLQEFFPGAAVEIGWDLLAAARALCGNEKGIACILGTGSNSCLYDGEKIVENVANLGWILADEGSGAYFGKKLIVDYLRKQMPEKLALRFKERFPWTREELLEKVYQQEKPSTFLAGFTKFIFQNLKESYCYQLVYHGFEEFYENNVMKYDVHAEVKVHFTGSVAFYFRNILRQVANDKGITVKNILETPIAGLALYHQKDLQ